MKKHFYLFAVIMLSMAVSFTSCNDDDDDDDNGNGGGTSALTSGTWSMTGLTISPPVNINGVEISDFFPTLPACVKDDIISFLADGTLSTDEGPTKCDPNDPQTTTGTWSYDGSTLTINDPDGDLQTINVSELTNSTLRGTYTMTDDFGNGNQEYTFTVTMSKN